MEMRWGLNWFWWASPSVWRTPLRLAPALAATVPTVYSACFFVPDWTACMHCSHLWRRHPRSFFLHDDRWVQWDDMWCGWDGPPIMPHALPPLHAPAASQPPLPPHVPVTSQSIVFRRLPQLRTHVSRLLLLSLLSSSSSDGSARRFFFARDVHSIVCVTFDRHNYIECIF